MNPRKEKAPDDGAGASNQNRTAAQNGITTRANSNSDSQTSLQGVHYVYTDEMGAPLFRVVRYYDEDGNKRFLQQAWDATEERWLRTLNGARRVPYKLPEVIAGVKARKRIYVVEGEKDVQALRALGKVATCNPMGAGKFRPEFAQYFRGADVRIIQDKDAAGHIHAKQVEKLLKPVAKSVRVTEVRGDGNDVSDALEAGKGLALVPARRYAHPRPSKRPPTPDPDEVIEPLEGGRGVQAVLSRLHDVVEESQGQWSARCPAHDDRVRSLSVGVGRDHPVKLYCHAGCKWHEVLAAVGLARKAVM